MPTETAYRAPRELYAFEDWRARYNRMKAIAERVRLARNRRAREACRRAGLDPSLLGIHPHNAMCGYRAGKPWAGIDYREVRRCLWLIDRQWDADRIVSAWDARVRGYEAPEYVQETMRKLSERRARRTARLRSR